MLFQVATVRRRTRADPNTIHTALSIAGRYCCTAAIYTAVIGILSNCISIYTAISCSDMKAHGNRRQGGFLDPKVGVVQFSTSRKWYLKSTNRQNKKTLFILVLIQVPLARFHPPPRIGQGRHFPKLFLSYTRLYSHMTRTISQRLLARFQRGATCLGANVSPGQHMHIQYLAPTPAPSSPRQARPQTYIRFPRFLVVLFLSVGPLFNYVRSTQRFRRVASLELSYPTVENKVLCVVSSYFGEFPRFNRQKIKFSESIDVPEVVNFRQQRASKSKWT